MQCNSGLILPGGSRAHKDRASAVFFPSMKSRGTSSQTVTGPAVRMSLKELVDHFNNWVAGLSDMRPQSRATYERALGAFLSWFPIDRKFLFTSRDVDRYQRYLVDKRGLRPATVATYLT